MPHSVGSPGLVGIITVCLGEAYFSLLLWPAAPHEKLILSAVPGQDRTGQVMAGSSYWPEAILGTLCIFLL